MRHEDNVRQVLPDDDIRDVGNMRREVHLFGEKVRPLAEARHRRRKDLMPFRLKKIRNAPPTPSTVPGAVNEHERFRRRLRGDARQAESARQDGCASNCSSTSWFYGQDNLPPTFHRFCEAVWRKAIGSICAIVPIKRRLSGRRRRLCAARGMSAMLASTSQNKKAAWQPPFAFSACLEFSLC